MPGKKPSSDSEVIDIAGKKIREEDAVPAEVIRPSISSLIKKKYPHWSRKSYISRDELKLFRREYIEELIKKESGELSHMHKEVLNGLLEHESIVKNMNVEIDRNLKLGDRLSDRIASFAGSWTFIIIFFTLLFLWITVNSVNFFIRPADPYPYILLNLILSCLASIQAPVILMSQNRKEARDRLRGENDYKVNLKSELEIRLLHEKIDHLTQTQWKRLLEIQQLQIDFMDENFKRARRE